MMNNHNPLRKTRASVIAFSNAMQQVLRAAEAAAAAPGNVLIQGAAGTGKSLVARVIHEESGPCGPFVMVDCSTLTVENLHTQLYGDSSRRALGRLEMAEDGTLFLKNLECLNPVAQERLAQLLGSGTYVNDLGEKRAVSFRVVSTADHAELEEKVRLGLFSAELCSRLGEAVIAMPGLSDRREDIPALSIYILDEIAQREKIDAPRVPYHYMELLTKIEWPENVRQLRNHLQSVLVLSEGRFDPEIIREHLVSEGEPATIKGAVTALWRKLTGESEARAATVTSK